MKGIYLGPIFGYGLIEITIIAKMSAKGEMDIKRIKNAH
jgi:hypothetical protein